MAGADFNKDGRYGCRMVWFLKHVSERDCCLVNDSMPETARDDRATVNQRPSQSELALVVSRDPVTAQLRNGIPSHDTFHREFGLLDRKELAASRQQ